MPNILAIDTALHTCSVALLAKQVMHYAEITEHRQSHQVLALIDQVMSSAKINLSQLDAIAFGAGPGSFTGIRLAASVAQALALPKNLPLIPISTLQNLAQKAHSEWELDNILVAIDAHRGEIYWGIYQLAETGIMQAVQKDSRCNPSLLSIPKQGNWVGIGDGWDIYGQQLAIIKQSIRIYPENIATARELLAIATVEFAQGHYVAAEEAQPNYLLDSSAWN